jgi:phage terminase small subunit
MTPKLPSAPRHLRPPTRAWFAQVCTEFVLEPHHLRLLQLACESWDRAEQAKEALKKNGLTFVDRFSQPHARPEVAIERDARISFARLLRELALDIAPPDSRPPRRGGQRR